MEGYKEGYVYVTKAIPRDKIMPWLAEAASQGGCVELAGRVQNLMRSYGHDADREGCCVISSLYVFLCVNGGDYPRVCSSSLDKRADKESESSLSLV